MGIQLSQVIPWGRSWSEYQRMFALSPDDLRAKILGCGDGPASFNAEATAQGQRVVSCDPIYAFSAAEIEGRVRACYDDLIAQVWQQRDGFLWTEFRDPDHLGACRLQAMQAFLADYPAGLQASRYVAAALPELPFERGQFDLALVSHFLFLYSDRFDLAFHLASFRELLRVAREVRVFPLLDLARARSAHLGPLCASLRDAGFFVKIRRVSYEFQRGGNELLSVQGSP